MYNLNGSEAQKEGEPMIEELLLNPNVAYLLLVAGLFLAMMAILSPGTGIFEIAALICLVLAGWGMYQLQVNWWALVLLGVGVALFILAVRRPKDRRYLALSLAALGVGSAFLFRGEGYLPAVNPFLALAVSLLVGGFMWIVATKSMEASLEVPTHDLGRLVGAVGEAKTDILLEGSVQVDGELWSATSKERIPEGATIRVIDRDGFLLEVAEIKEEP